MALNTILTVNGGTIDNASSVDLDDDSHLKPNCAVLLSGGGKAVINGGTLRGMRGVAVTGYITKEVEGLYKDTFGIEGYNNDTYGNELTVTGGNICATSGEGLIVYEKAKKIELSGGTFTTQSNAYSIWVADTEAGRGNRRSREMRRACWQAVTAMRITARNVYTARTARVLRATPPWRCALRTSMRTSTRMGTWPRRPTARRSRRRHGTYHRAGMW